MLMPMQAAILIAYRPINFLPDLLFFRIFLIFHFQYSMIKGTILNKGNNKITELQTILQRGSPDFVCLYTYEF
jgi:hypothetical protein